MTVLALAALISYLIGSISFSTIIARLVVHVDIREQGSRNAGATNTLRVVGLRWGLMVLGLDILKGVVVAILARYLTTNEVVVYAAGLAVICGHNWPVYFRFRGGKGVATTIGVLLVVLPYPTLLAAGFAVTLIVLTRFVSLGSLSLVTLTAMFAATMYTSPTPAIFASILALFSILRHHENVRRLWRGTERRLFARDSTKQAEQPLERY